MWQLMPASFLQVMVMIDTCLLVMVRWYMVMASQRVETLIADTDLSEMVFDTTNLSKPAVAGTDLP